MDQATIIRRAVVATDGSEQAHAAAVFASSFAWPPSSIIWVASVIEAPPPDELAISRMRGKGFSDWRQVLEQSHLEARDQAQSYVSDAAGILRERHPEVEIKEVVRVGEPAAELLSLAGSVEAELVISGARGRTALQSLLLGSVSETLVSEGPCPVLVVRQPITELRTILVAVHAPDDADRLAETCLRLPLPPSTRIVVVTASAPRPFEKPGHQPFAPGRVEALLEVWAESESDGAELAGQRFGARVVAADPDRTVEARIARGEVRPSSLEARADVVPALLAEAEARDASLIVVGAREHRGLVARLGLGSVSRKLVRRSSRAILIVREVSGG